MHVSRPDKSPTGTIMDNMLHFQSSPPNQTKFVFQSFTSDEHDCTAVHSNIFEPNTISLQDTAYLEQTSQKMRN